MFNPKKIRILSLSFTSLILISFQNCSNDEFKAAQNLSSFNTNTATLDVGDDHPTVFKQVRKSEVQALFSNRVLVLNTLKDIFGPSQNAQLTESIGWSAKEFGSGWGIYDKILTSSTSCAAKKNAYYACSNIPQNSAIASQIGASAPREGLRISSCNLVVDNNVSLAFAFNRIEKGATLANPPLEKEQNLTRAFQLFYRGRPLPDDNFFDSLSIILNQSKDSKEGWKNILLSLCLSPHWQVL